MAADKWSEKQREVIDSRKENLLVSAAAGAGKTSVLVERILRLITDEGQDVDRLLVVTFTRDAASNMREKLADGLEKLIMADPDDRRLQKQQMLLHNASITTIDSFCNSVVKEFFHETDIDPAFRIGRTAELVLMRNKVLSDLIEEYYASGDQAFADMIESYTSSKSDASIEELILRLASAAEAQAWPGEWLDRLEAEFTAESEGRSGIRDEWKQFIFGYVRAQITDMLPRLGRALEICGMDNGPAAYTDVIASELAAAEKVAKAADYDTLADMLSGMDSFQSLPRASGVDENLKERVKDTRDAYKKLIGDLHSRYFSCSEADTNRELSAAAGPVVTLIRITKEFMRRFLAHKKEKNVLDFGDIEHFTLEILTARDENGGIVPSHAATELRDRFTDIFVDEYQDSNFIQEQIINIIAKDSGTRPYTFMVGDVKQSIYRFRMAKPELFMRRFERYRRDQKDGRVICLGQNYRSRPEVLDSTNEVFYASMRREIGGIDYDEEAALVCGQRLLAEDGMPKLPENRTELIVLSDKDADEEEGTGAEALRHLEAAAVAKRIKQLIASGLIIDKGTEKEHPVGYGDIVILLRTMKSWGDCYAEELEAKGIPTYYSSGGGFLGTYEVTAMLQYLKILNNPRQDIPLAAVLKSELAGLTSDELVSVRTFGGSGRCFWDCVEMYSKEGPDDGLRAKIDSFLKIYNDIRSMNLNRDIPRVIEAIYDRTGFDLYCAALPGGDRRALNLEMLSEYAAEYEAGSFSGLYSFVRYLEQIIDSEQDLEEASGAEAGNSVRIMSIHRSKGLEFPIVFVGGMGKQLTDQDSTKSVIISSDHGIGAKYTDLTLRRRKDTYRRFLIQKMMQMDFMGEELRLLYVAMTRAKQKLIMAGALRKTFYKPEKWQDAADSSNTAYSVAYIEKASCYMDFVYPAALRYPEDFEILKTGGDEAGAAGPAGENAADEADLAGTDAAADGPNGTAAALNPSTDVEKIKSRRAEFENLKDPGDSEIRELLRFVYPSRSALPVKLSVSDLKHASMEEAGETASWVSGAPSGGAVRGTVYHLVMQFIPFTLKGEDEVRAFLDSLEKSGIIDEAEKALVKPSDIAAFLDTELAARMAASDAGGHLRREQPFVLGRKACDIDPVRFAGAEDIIPVQGIIDCMFSENGRYVILDYKTDRVGPGEEEVLIKRYREQLKNYAEAVSRIIGEPVEERVLYSFSLGKTIEV